MKVAMRSGCKLCQSIVWCIDFAVPYAAHKFNRIIMKACSVAILLKRVILIGADVISGL